MKNTKTKFTSTEQNHCHKYFIEEQEQKALTKVDRNLLYTIMILILIIVILLFLSSLSGCGTIMHGPTQDIMITSNPPGAIVTNTEYTCWIKTPGIMTLKRNDSTELTARLFKYEEQKVKIKASISPWVLGNGSFAWYDVQWFTAMDYPGCYILTLGDIATGSIGTLSPNTVHFEMKEKRYVNKYRY